MFTPNGPNLRCPRNGKQTSHLMLSGRSAFIPQPLENWFRPDHREGDEGRSASPDTGQRGGGAFM